MKKRKLISKGKIVLAGCLFWLLALLLGACGGREAIVTEYGVDGFAYIPKKILIKNLQQGLRDIQVAGDWLYYSQSMGKVITVKKMAMDILEEATEEWNFSDEGTVLLAFSMDVVPLPDGTLDSGREVDYVPLLDQALESGKNTSSSMYHEYAAINLEKEYCSFYLKEFMADKNGNVTYAVNIMAGRGFEMETMGTMLCRQNADGSLAYRLFFPSDLDFTVDGSGRTYLLEEEGIRILDENGQSVNLVVPGGYQYAADFSHKPLYGDGDAGVYYLDRTMTVYEIQMSGSEPRLAECKGLDKGSDKRYYVVPGGSLLCSNVSEGVLYEWDRESASQKQILRWQDSDMLSGRIQAIAPVGPDRLIVASWGLADGVFLLTKTPVEEIPRGESVVMACLYPTDWLWEEVTEFNLTSSKYRIIVERYGAVGYMAGDDPEAEIRLDATLVSDNPPDILVLDNLDILKYSNQQGMEDLSSYLEEGSPGRGDFLENILDGGTVDGRLVCIPGGIYIDAFYGRSSQLEGFDSWTMEDVYQLTEQYPDADLFYGKTRDYMLETFCAPYYLEKFIDWEEGECDFESEEFRRLVLWIEENFRDEPGTWFRYDEPFPENVLLAQEQVNNFVEPLRQEAFLGDEIRMIGFPGAGGGGRIGYQLRGAMGISSNSRHKDGAWNFLEFHLTYDEDKGNGVYHGTYIPTFKPLLADRYEIATMEQYKMNDENGNPVPESGKIDRFEYQVGGETIGYTCVPQRLADELRSAVENLDISPRPAVERLIVGIVAEEVGAYYGGDKPLEEVAEIIQSRVGILVQEYTLD